MQAPLKGTDNCCLHAISKAHAVGRPVSGFLPWSSVLDIFENRCELRLVEKNLVLLLSDAGAFELFAAPHQLDKLCLVVGAEHEPIVGVFLPGLGVIQDLLIFFIEVA